MDTMCADKAISWRPDVIYAFAEDEGQAGALALRCGAPLAELNVHTFPDGETLVTAEPTVQSIQGSALIYKSLHHPNGKLVDLLFAADAVRSLCARSVILAAPYMPYMRQDRAFQLGQAVSQKVFGQALGQAFDGLVTVQPHLHRTSQLSAVTGRPALSLNAGRAIAAHMAAQTDADTIIVGPDEESQSLVADVAAVLGLRHFTARKQRTGDHDVDIDLPVGADFIGRPVVIVDDIVSSGVTIATLSRRLSAAGASRISVYAVHALHDAKAASLMRDAGVRNVVSVDGITHETNAISIVDIFAEALGTST